MWSSAWFWTICISFKQILFLPIFIWITAILIFLMYPSLFIDNLNCIYLIIWAIIGRHWNRQSCMVYAEYFPFVYVNIHWLHIKNVGSMILKSHLPFHKYIYKIYIFPIKRHRSIVPPCTASSAHIGHILGDHAQLTDFQGCSHLNLMTHLIQMSSCPISKF